MKALEIKALLQESWELAKAHPEQVRSHKPKENQGFISNYMNAFDKLAENPKANQNNSTTPSSKENL